MPDLNIENFMEDLKKFSGNKINNTEDLKFLISSVYKNNRVEEFEQITFTAKYINGLKRVLKSGSGNPEISNINQIREDLADNYNKITVQINKLLANEKEGSLLLFKQKYLGFDQESFTNLNSLLNDLEWCKMYQNQRFCNPFFKSR
jgi:hypothetical protein